MRAKRGALDSTVQTCLRTKARVCVSVYCGADVDSACEGVCVRVLWGQVWGSACEGLCVCICVLWGGRGLCL